ncbi:hypothetical protein B7463_g7823, partial [Scytalidium lignicola]
MYLVLIKSPGPGAPNPAEPDRGVEPAGPGPKETRKTSESTPTQAPAGACWACHACLVEMQSTIHNN